MLAIEKSETPMLCINGPDFREYLQGMNTRVFTDGWHYTQNSIMRLFNMLFLCRPIALDSIANLDTTSYPIMIQYDFYNPKVNKVILFKHPDCKMDHFIVGDLIRMENYQVRGILSSKSYDQSLLIGKLEEETFEELANFYRIFTGYHRDNYQLISQFARKVGMDDIDIQLGTFIHIRDNQYGRMIILHKVIKTDVTPNDLFMYDLAELMGQNTIRRIQGQYDYDMFSLNGHLETDYYVGDELIGLLGVLKQMDIKM